MCDFCPAETFPQGMTTVTFSTFSKQDLLEALKDCANMSDIEQAHFDADEYLLRFINDVEIGKAFDAVKKYYA